MSHPAFCTFCGTTLPEGGISTACVRCQPSGLTDPTVPVTLLQGPGIWPSVAEIQAALPDLLIGSELGRGGMAVVHRAHQPRLDRPVALKILAPGLASQPDFAARFSREARLLARLSHPNIVGIYDSGFAGGFYYLIMELVDGTNLRQAMRSGAMGLEQLLRILPVLCDTLQFAHTEGVLHRDIKPDNILIDHKGRVKIADFGIARLAGNGPDEPRLTLSGMHLGTPAYMAPEQIERAAEVDHRADIYSLGVVIYEMLTGGLPIGHFPKPSQKIGVDSRLDGIVLRALAKDPAQRFQSAAELRSHLEELFSGPPGPAAPFLAGLPGSSGEKPTRMSLLAVTAGLCTGLSLLSPAAIVATILRTTLNGDLTPEKLKALSFTVPPATAFLLPAGMLTGILAILCIRRSRGKLSGAGLAIVAALLWPLLLANVLAMAFGLAAIDHWLPARHHAAGSPESLVYDGAAIATAAGMIALNFGFVGSLRRWTRCDRGPGQVGLIRVFVVACVSLALIPIGCSLLKVTKDRPTETVPDAGGFGRSDVPENIGTESVSVPRKAPGRPDHGSR